MTRRRGAKKTTTFSGDAAADAGKSSGKSKSVSVFNMFHHHKDAEPETQDMVRGMNRQELEQLVLRELGDGHIKSSLVKKHHKNYIEGQIKSDGLDGKAGRVRNSRHTTGEGRDAELEAKFAVFDSNGDGEITLDEVRCMESCSQLPPPAPPAWPHGRLSANLLSHSELLPL